MEKPSSRGYRNRGRDQINIERVSGNVQLNSQESVRPILEQDLLEVVRQSVESRLRGQLHHRIRLNLQKETQPQQVRPWGMEVKVAVTQPGHLLSPETTIGQAFDQCSGRFLLLGEPGAGKTTSLLDLALELIDRAEGDIHLRIPVIIDLSDWQPTKPLSDSRLNGLSSKISIFSKGYLTDDSENSPIWSISDWLVSRISKRYGYQNKQVERWLEDKRLVPLLDGLDEVRPEYQLDCVQALNSWLNSDFRPRQVALCCRRRQYENFPEKLELEGAVYLQDLTNEQIQRFLTEASQNERRESDELRRSLVTDTTLLELIRRPLILSMAVLSYQEIERNKWKTTTSTGERLNLLLDAYVRQMLIQTSNRNATHRRRKSPSAEQSQKWLGVLALQLLQESKTEFSIERIQTEWLSTSLQKWLFCITATVVWGLMSAIVSSGLFHTVILWRQLFELSTSSWIKPKFVLWFGFGFGILKGLQLCLSVLRDTRRIEQLIETFLGSSTGIILQKIIRKLLSWRTKLVPNKIRRLTTNLKNLSGPKWVFNFEDWDSDIENLSTPNQGIENLKQNASRITLICVLSFNSAVGITKYFKGEHFIFSSFGYSFFCSLCIALFIWIVLGGGRIYIEHYLVRFPLYCTGFVPKDYSSFLNYATNQLLLQRIGGRYRFMHDLLRQSLAQRRIDTYPHLISPQVFFRCGQSYYFMGQNEKALQNLDQAINLEPKYRKALVARADTY